MHGVKREPNWTYLKVTANVDEISITLDSAVDWQVGELIAIATTSFNAHESEKRTITAITAGSAPVITLDKKLDFKHFAGIETFGSKSMDMRAEVALLTRNVLLRGDPETSLTNQYGANIFIHSEGDDSVIGRLANIELFQVGQAFKVGRYAIHFHMIGAVHKSYAIGCSVHEGFNRAFTIHGTHHLRLLNNIAYHVKGHNFFIEDAVEKYNVIRDNLVMRTTRSWSLLNTD